VRVHGPGLCGRDHAKERACGRERIAEKEGFEVLEEPKRAAQTSPKGVLLTEEINESHHEMLPGEEMSSQVEKPAEDTITQTHVEPVTNELVIDDVNEPDSISKELPASFIPLPVSSKDDDEECKRGLNTQDTEVPGPDQVQEFADVPDLTIAPTDLVSEDIPATSRVKGNELSFVKEQSAFDARAVDVTGSAAAVEQPDMLREDSGQEGVGKPESARSRRKAERKRKKQQQQAKPLAEDEKTKSSNSDGEASEPISEMRAPIVVAGFDDIPVTTEPMLEEQPASPTLQVENDLQRQPANEVAFPMPSTEKLFGVEAENLRIATLEKAANTDEKSDKQTINMSREDSGQEEIEKPQSSKSRRKAKNAKNKREKQAKPLAEDEKKKHSILMTKHRSLYR